MILPKFKKDWININNDGEPCSPPSHWMAEAKSIEWFGCGITYYIGEVISVDSFIERLNPKFKNIGKLE